MANEEIIFQFKSRPEYFFIAALIGMSLLLMLVAVELCREMGRNCLTSISSCFAGSDVVAAVVFFVVLSAVTMTCLIIPWFLSGAYQLIITRRCIELVARRRRIIVESSRISTYRLNLVKSRVELYDKLNRRSFQNWAGKSPEYSGSALDLCISWDTSLETFSFPLGVEFSRESELIAALAQLGKRQSFQDWRKTF
jgi:hypothetical protein